MKRKIYAVLAVLFLAGCTQAEPTPPAAQSIPTQPPTSTPALAMMAPTSEPTVAPTAFLRVTHKVERGTIDDLVTLNAQIVPSQHELSFAQEGVLKRMFVQVGQQVKPGDLVAELDMGDLETQLQQAQLTAHQDQAQLARANQAGQLQVREAEINLESERARLEALKAPPAAVEITKAQTALRQAQTSLETTRNDASQAKNLAYAEMIDAQRALAELRARYDQAVEKAKHPPKASPNEPNKAEELQKAVEELQTQVRQGEDRQSRAVISFDTARNNEVAAVQQGEAAVQAAQAELDALLGGPNPVAIGEQERVVRRAELAVEQAKQQAAPDPTLQRAVQSDALQIQQINGQIEDRRLYASTSGEVATVTLSAGSPVQAGNAIATLVNSSTFELVADASDALADGHTSLLRVNPGQPVVARFSRYPDTSFNGTVTRVPRTGGEGSVSNDYYVSFDTQNREFAPGDSAEMVFALGRKYDVLLLPTSAVHITPDRSYVVVLNGNSTRRVDVVTGIVSNTQVEIVRGLQQGEIVVDQAP